MCACVPTCSYFCSKSQDELPPEKVAEIRDVFSMFDKDDSGDIDAVELKVETPRTDIVDLIPLLFAGCHAAVGSRHDR